jgi:hypothetical protein
MPATCPAHLLLVFIILIIFDEELKEIYTVGIVRSRYMKLNKLFI